MLKRYKYDPTGRSTDNLVKRELHTLDVSSGTSNGLYFPRYGAYYGDSIIVTQGSTTLVKNEDWQYAFFWQDVSAQTGSPVFLAIQIINENLIGDIELQYQVVGGDYSGRSEGIDKILANLPKQNRNVYWDDVINIPEAFIPQRHMHDIFDVFGINPLVIAIDELRTQIGNNSVLKLKTVYDRFLKLKQYVEGLLDTFNNQSKDIQIKMDALSEKMAGLISRTEAEMLIDEKVEEALPRIVPLIDAVSKSLEAYKKEIANNFKLVDGQIVNLTNVVEINKTASETRDEQLRSELNQRIDTVSNQVEKVNTTRQANYDTLDARITANRQYTDTRATATIQAANTLIENARDNLNEKIDANNLAVTDRITAIDNKVDNTATSLLSRLSTVETGALAAQRTQQEKLDELELKANNLFSTLDNNLATLQNVVNQSNEALKGSWTSVGERMDTLETNLANEYKKWQPTKDYIDDEVSKASNTATTNLANLETTLRTEITSVSATLEPRITKNEQDILNAVNETASLKDSTDKAIVKLGAKDQELEDSLAGVEKQLEQIETSKEKVIDLSSENDDLFYPIEIHGLTSKERVKVIVQYETVSSTKFGNDAKLYLEYETLNEKGMYAPNGREVEAFDFTPLTIHEPPVFNLVQNQGTDILYLRGGASYKVSYKSKDTTLEITSGSGNSVTSVPIAYSSDKDILTNDGKLDKAINQEEAARLSQKNDILAIVDTKIDEIGKLDPDSVKQFIKQVLDSITAKSIEEAEKSNGEYVFPEVPIVPDDTNSFNKLTGVTITNIQHMDGSSETNSEIRSIFAPSRCFEYEKNADFAIPESYDGLLAQVVLITAYRPMIGNNNTDYNAIMTPSVKVGYVVLKGNTSVPITVGGITSFGKYLTNDGVDKQGMVVTPQPIFGPASGYTLKSEADLTRLVGTGGKVMIFV